MTHISDKITELGKKILVSVGKNNKPTYAVMAIATANGIFKPISSLTDKKEKPEARKYAALREFVTECVAVPTYWACGVGAAAIGQKLFKNNPEKKAVAKANMMFVGVCTAAVAVIPAVCSGALWALDKITGKNNKQNKSDEPARLKLTSLSPDLPVYNNDARTKFGNLYSTPSLNTFINKGELKI